MVSAEVDGTEQRSSPVALFLPRAARLAYDSRVLSVAYFGPAGTFTEEALRSQADLAAGKAAAATDKKYRDLTSIVGPDPLPFGMAANKPTIEALESYAFKQRLTLRRMTIPELFVDPQAA